MTATSKLFFGTLNAVFALVLAVISASATAEVWIDTGRTDDYIAYADPSSIRRDGDIAKMWSLFDYKNAQQVAPGKMFQSSKRQVEYDCKQGRSRALAAISYTGHEGKGETIASENTKYNWRPVVPDSVE